jgi:hypothetical protein
MSFRAPYFLISSFPPSHVSLSNRWDAPADMLLTLVSNLHADVKSFARRKQDGIMSKTMVATINQVLTDVREFLKDEPSAKFLKLLDDVTLPQNGDALIFLGQYKSAMETFQRKHSYDDYGTRKWNDTEEEVC